MQMHVHTTLVNEQQESSVCSSTRRMQEVRLDGYKMTAVRGSSFTGGAW
jgi:hypothetical protein